MATKQKTPTKKEADYSTLGIKRMKKGRGFAYYSSNGQLIRSAEILARIKGLVIPPIWSDVWISASPKDHLQAVGLDIKGRRQYIYSTSWVEKRNKEKFEHLADFGKRLPDIRKQIRKDLKRESLDLRKVSAIALTVLDQTAIRVGNEQYSKAYGSYGLTTLRKKHIHKDNKKITLKYIGKKAVPQEKTVDSKKLIHYIEELMESRGKHLFVYVNQENKRTKLHAADLNSYLQECASTAITCKTFRTWHASLKYLFLLLQTGNEKTEKERVKRSKDAEETVAKYLGNSRTVTNKHYIFPLLREAYVQGTLESWIKRNNGSNKTKKLKLAEKKLRQLATNGN